MFKIPDIDYKELKDLLGFIRADEAQVIKSLQDSSAWNDCNAQEIEGLAAEWVTSLRKKRLSGLSLDAFFQQYKLSSSEGLALMCLAEALMRVPDSDNIDALIADKISSQTWIEQVGKSSSIWINASSFGLYLGGKVMSEKNSGSFLIKAVDHITKKISAPVLRQSIKQCMGLLGRQFVMGESIENAISRARKSNNYLYSYDMLGEAAKTHADANKYYQDYMSAIKKVGESSDKNKSIFKKPSISVKISALHPRYEMSSYSACFEDIVTKIINLSIAAKDFNIGLTLDAEESDRLALSLLIFKRVLLDDKLQGWSGLGLAVQAYLKCAGKTIELVASWAKKYGKRIPIRLVKGAYWDTEIKDTQVRGLADYPVFTRKVSTDVHYLLCAERMLAQADFIYPQFATHNAFSVAMIWQKGSGVDYEFQCLHGMGQNLYDSLLEIYPNMICRNYAPVGRHAELLPYLVRRLLENGANTSFVNQVLDETIDVKSLVKSPFDLWSQLKIIRNDYIPLPADLFGATRANSSGININDLSDLNKIFDVMSNYRFPETCGVSKADAFLEQKSPVDSKVWIKALLANADNVELAYNSAHIAYLSWHKENVSFRANILRRAADIMQERMAEIMSICIYEAGKTYQDAIDEVREAIDFLRYYASLSEVSLSSKTCPGPTGELNTWTPLGRGVVLCISPWNFPLAIFLGQVTAALVAGNAVIAKPATQTIAIANWAVNVLYEAGLPENLLHLVPGKRDEIGEALIQNKHLKAVMLTGSTETGKKIAQSLSNRPGELVPLIAETGGQNAMIVDSTALTEQVVQDVVDSAFKSAGQRCSALRVLYIQEEVFDKTVNMIKGAMDCLRIGMPSDLESDVGPMIDSVAISRMKEHEVYLSSIDAKELAICKMPNDLFGNYYSPRMYQINSINDLKFEVFGPILHVVKFSRSGLEKCIDDINNTGFGLTLGIHSRLEQTIKNICERVRVGNIYVNRNMVGAVVGVQPFGGEGLSGTGPKAGGPWYLYRLCREQTISVNTTAVGGNAKLMTMEKPQCTGDLI